MRRTAAPVLLAALALSADTPTHAQNKPVVEQFTTADGVQLKGLFHKAANPTPGDPVVILLYPPGPGNDMAKPGNWAGLAGDLTKAGYHVFRFDWRGHGLSTNVVNPQAFWANPWNQKHVAGGNQKPPKAVINVKADIKPGYFPMYVNDLAAARLHLDLKNDAGVLNTGSIYLVGVGDTATLGMLWTASEWHRPAVAPNVVQLAGVPWLQVVPQPLVGGVGVEAGRDIAGAVWLSAVKSGVVSERPVKDWPVKFAPQLRAGNPMLFLYGDMDSLGRAQSKYFYDDILVAKGRRALGVKPLGQTFLTPVNGTKQSGVNLLGAKLETEDLILKYLSAVQRARGAIVPKRRNYANPYQLDLRYFGLLP